MASSQQYAAIVLGATGAVGREMVAELVESPRCSRVVAFARREIPQDQWQTTFPSLNGEDAKCKLEVRRVDFDHLQSSDFQVGDRGKGADAVFCCLGTTRKDAGSAEAFRKVDFEYVKRSAELAKEQQTPYFGLLTAMNANKNSWFLYPQTKGEIEEAIKTIEFPRTGIFRPGLIDRGDLRRSVESIISYVMPSVKARTIAMSMRVDYEDHTEKLKEWSMSDIKALQK